jgi:hypothetical protein
VLLATRRVAAAALKLLRYVIFSGQNNFATYANVAQLVEQWSMVHVRLVPLAKTVIVEVRFVEVSFDT